MGSRTARGRDIVIWLIATAGPIAVTALLLRFGGGTQRDYIFLYLGLVAVLGVVRGFGPAIVCAVVSFALLDFYFVPPYHTFNIADEQDIVNLLAFVATAAVVGLLASRRRDAQLEAEALARRLREANSEMMRLNREQAEAAQAALRLARSEQQVRALQETDRLRREVLANVSHELRTPLGTILAESTDHSHDLSPEEATRKLTTVASEAKRLRRLVDDMLDMAWIEGGALELNLEPILLADAIAASAERIGRRSPDRRLEWDRESAEVEVLADWDRLGQIFDNLIANADRFGPRGTPIDIKVSTETPGLVTVRVSDHGPGVPPELRDRIFDRFMRAGGAPASTHSAGTGLGLAIVKGLVEAHAGSIELEEPAAGEGATFRFTLPLADKQ